MANLFYVINDKICQEDRQTLIRMGLKLPEVEQSRVSGPNRTADISNAIYAVEKALENQPNDFLLRTVYSALRTEFPLHFAKTAKEMVEEALSQIRLDNNS